MAKLKPENEPYSSVRDCLIEQLGENCLKTKALYPLNFPHLSHDLQLLYDPYNRRLNAVGFSPSDFQELGLPFATPLDAVWVSKQTTFAPEGEDSIWRQLGFLKEGVIPRFFKGGAAAHVWASYPSTDRACAPQDPEHEHIVALARSKPQRRSNVPQGFTTHIGTRRDAPEIAALMSMMFADYPLPTHAAQIASHIDAGTKVFRILRNPRGQVVAAAAARLDKQNRKAEIMDCTTEDTIRSQGLMTHLLSSLEQDLNVIFKISNFYALARASEVGMNCVLSKLGYRFSGRLINDCRMPGGWESLNIWSKF